MSIGLVDTSIFCEIVPVPGRNQHREAVLAKLEDHIRSNVTLLLPIATILETGNHIAHISDGRQRRITATRFVELVQPALGDLGSPPPWTVPHPLLDPQNLQHYLSKFPDYAMQGIGLGDLSIIEEYDRQCRLHRARHVFIWSLDHHLAAYKRPAQM
ncbi:MAG: hypothetical protein ACLFTI_08230 [Anaerolineales bacterium]